MCPVSKEPAAQQPAPCPVARRSTPRAPISLPSNELQFPPNRSRQEERRGGQRLAQVQVAEILGRATPMGEQHVPACVPDQALKCQDEDEDVVHLTVEGDEVRNEIERQRDV